MSRPQSKSPYDMRALPPLAVLRVVKILTKGAKKYGLLSWKRYDKFVHVARATAHLVLWAAGDRSEDNLGNAVCRLMFAIETEELFEDHRKTATEPVSTEAGVHTEGHVGSGCRLRAEDEGLHEPGADSHRTKLLL